MKKIFKRIRDFISNNKLLVLTFLLSTIVINTLYMMFSVAPYGDRSMLCIDFYHQYGPMLGELYDRVHGFDSLIYSFTMGMGLPFFRNFLNYLSSPFNIIMFIFPRGSLVMSYGIVIAFKAIVSSITMNYFLSKKFNTKSLAILPLGILYAFSAYFSAYYWNIMWLDGMVFLPLIVLGIENIVNNSKWKLYTISLTIMLISNYYIGYMICIFSVVYFILYIIYKTNFLIKDLKKELFKQFKKCLLFASASLIAGMIASFLLIPMFKSTASISATGGSWPTSQYYDFTIKDYLLSHFSITETVTFASDAITYPNISCGILGIALTLLFIINHKIKIKTKVIYLLLLGFLIACFFSPSLDYIMQAFHVPNDLPYRYSFLYTFTIITICAYSLLNIKKMKLPIVTIVYVLLMIGMVFITKFVHWPNLEINNMYINMILLTLYFIFYACEYCIENKTNFFYIAIGIVACIDVLVSINYNWDITQDINLFNEDYDATEKLLDRVKDYDNEKFYRIENTQQMTLNDGSWYNYNGMTTFTSMAYENMAVLQHNLGMPGNEINSYYYVQQTPIYDLMFDMKYFIGTTVDYERYQELFTEEETANEFKYNVGLGFAVDKNIKNWLYTSTNPFSNQNSFIETTTGIKDTLEEVSLRYTDELYTDEEFTILKYTYEDIKDNLYFYTNNSAIEFFIIGKCLYYNNSDYVDYLNLYPELEYDITDSNEEAKIINISTTGEELDIIVGYKNYFNSGINLYQINHDKFESAYNILNENKLEITSFKESHINGTININEDKTIYTSIPYDDGWNVYIDNKKVDTKKIGNALIGVDVTKGKHKIEFVYHIPYMKYCLPISLIGLSILIFSNKLKLPKKEKKIKK